MPGILPMKVIKVGLNAQTRIAQACDRCRSKKIRCDGIRPCCSQCSNVGFECKTSDKLSRRAFPRGYTESLEERVRVLESEVRELKELLDEKDEKIDLLSRLHSQSTHAFQLQSPRRTSTTSISSKDGKGDSPEKEETFKVQQSPYLLDSEGSDSYFSGTSSSRTFIEAFKHKVQEKGRSTADINTNQILNRDANKSDTSIDPDATVTWKSPPRLVSDQLINIYFQEWAPLFPILHRPTFLGLYEKYVADSDQIADKAELAQLNLVFGIAALSSGTRSSEDLESFETQWKAALDTILTDNSMVTLQALILAQIFCVLKGDLKRLSTYKGLSTTLSAHLGLHQSQKRFTLGTLMCETRKKVFWTLYTVDSFTAVTLGLPKHLKDADVQCELPTDADDEYVTERGFQPTLPGESTKLSSALALFRAAQILSRVLEEVFPAKTSYDLSLKKLSDLQDELDDWSANLAPHLRLQFVQDKPSTGTVNSRSPLLSLTYHYIRALIQRPAICASSLGTRSNSCMITMAKSCKHMIQIVQLLKERGLSFAFCLNRDEILVLSGFGLLFQGLNLDQNSKILKDNQKMVCIVNELLEKSGAPCASEFKRVAFSFLPSPPTPKQRNSDTPKICKPPPQLSRHHSDGAVDAAPIMSPTSSSSARKQLKAIASRFTGGAHSKKPSLNIPVDARRATVHNISLHPNGVPSQSVPSFQPPRNYDPSSISRSEPARSPVNIFSRPSSTQTLPRAAPPQHHINKAKPRQAHPHPTLTNLDYLSFGTDTEFGPTQNQNQNTRPSTQPVKAEPTPPTDWEKLLANLETGSTNIYDNVCYSGTNHSQPIDALGVGSLGMQHHHSNHSAATLNDVSWGPASDLWTLSQTTTNASLQSVGSHTTGSGSGSGQADSIFSELSTDEGNMNSSTEDFASPNWGLPNGNGHGAITNDAYRGIVMPAEELNFDGGWDGSGLNL